MASATLTATLDDLILGRVPEHECTAVALRVLKCRRSPVELRAIIRHHELLDNEVARALYLHPDLDASSRNMLVRTTVLYGRPCGFDVTTSGEFVSEADRRVLLELGYLWGMSDLDRYGEVGTVALELSPESREILVGLLRDEPRLSAGEWEGRARELIEIARRLN